MDCGFSNGPYQNFRVEMFPKQNPLDSGDNMNPKNESTSQMSEKTLAFPAGHISNLAKRDARGVFPLFLTAV